MFLSTGDTQRLIGYSLWSSELPQDLANAHHEMLTARGKAAIDCKINNSNFGPLHETKDLHASPASIGRIKKHKEHKKHKTPQCAYTFSEIAGPFSAYRAFRAIFFLARHKTSRAESKTQSSAARKDSTRVRTGSNAKNEMQTGAGKTQK